MTTSHDLHNSSYFAHYLGIISVAQLLGRKQVGSAFMKRRAMKTWGCYLGNIVVGSISHITRQLKPLQRTVVQFLLQFVAFKYLRQQLASVMPRRVIWKVFVNFRRRKRKFFFERYSGFLHNKPPIIPAVNYKKRKTIQALIPWKRPWKRWIVAFKFTRQCVATSQARPSGNEEMALWASKPVLRQRKKA